MANPALDQFSQGIQSTVLTAMLLAALTAVVIGLPLYWLRLKLERKLIQVARSARARREARKFGGVASIAQLPHCPVCNSVMVRRTARRGNNAGSEFWGCPNYPKCRGTR